MKSAATKSGAGDDDNKSNDGDDEEKVSLAKVVSNASSSLGSDTGWWDHLLQIVEWDHENYRLLKLAIPYTGQALVAGIAEAARVAVVGKFYGTRELAAYVIVVRSFFPSLLLLMRCSSTIRLS